MRNLSYVPGVDTEFCEDRTSYKASRIDYDPLSDECIARFRRLRIFEKASGLVQETRIPSFRHCEIFEKITHGYDHESSWWLVLDNFRIPFYMMEPYGQYEFEIDGLKYHEVPKNIAPYGAINRFIKGDRREPDTTSYLFVKTAHYRHLVDVIKRLEATAKSAPYFKSVTAKDRREAKRRVRAEKGLIVFGGSHGV